MDLLESDSWNGFAGPDERPSVIALHCSGATGWEWRLLDSYIGHRFSLITPNLIGTDGAERWSGEHEFRLTDEAAPIVSAIDAARKPVHLVGHSYGGAVALRCAIERPAKIASLTLYEPAAFYALRTMVDGIVALDQITAIANEVGRCILTGAYRAAAKQFVEFWNGHDSWTTMRPETQDAVIRYIPKVYLEFSAMVGERISLTAYQQLSCPVLLLQGDSSPEPMRMIARQLTKSMRLVSLRTVSGAGHMGPLSHAADVCSMMANHVLRAEARLSRGEQSLEADIHRAA